MASAWSENMLPSDHRKQAIEELGRGREKTNQLRDLLICSSNNNSNNYNNNNNKYYCNSELGGGVEKGYCEDLLVEILNSFANTLSILRKSSGSGSSSSGGGGSDYEEVSQSEKNNLNANLSCLDGRKSEDSSGDSAKSTSARKDRRGSYKRRKCEESRVEYTPTLVDDGHAWRKYGQKDILHAKHPRNYYRCTHKDQGCQATKQVQKMEDNPPKYQTTYFGRHTCNSDMFKPSQQINGLQLQDYPATASNDDHYAVLISFANHSKQDPNFFSSSTFPSSDSVLVKQETKESDTLPISDISYNRPSPSSDYLLDDFDDLLEFA